MIVLEARDRVGGRVWNHNLGGGVVSERGGTFVGPTQDRVLALAKEFGIGTFPVYDTGDDLYLNGSTRLRYTDTNPLTGNAPPDPLALPNLATVISQLDDMSKSVPGRRAVDGIEGAASGTARRSRAGSTRRSS